MRRSHCCRPFPWFRATAHNSLVDGSNSSRPHHALSEPSVSGDSSEIAPPIGGSRCDVSSLEQNPLWGAPRIHGELLKLGIDVGQTSVAKYMARRRGAPSQGWKTFLHNHADGIAAMDLFVVPTVSFRLLYGLLIMSHSRRRMLWLGVTAHPTAEWLANQLTQGHLEQWSILTA